MNLKFLWIAFAFFFINHSFAQLAVGDTFDDGTLTYAVENLTPLEAQVKGFKTALTADSDLTIPSSVTVGSQTFSIVGIATNAFRSSSTAGIFLKNIVFPETLRYIESSAFQGGRLLTFTLTNPAALTSIGAAVFAGNTTLKSADLSNIAANLSSATSMFNNCSSLTSFTMKNNTTTTVIPAVFLGSCTAMTTADFTGCTNITSIGDNAFRNDSALQTLTLATDTPPSATTGTNGTFANMTDNNRELNVPTYTGVFNYLKVDTWTAAFGNIKSLAPLPPSNSQRPMIWVKNSEKQGILENISNNAWKNSYYISFRNRVNTELANYNLDRKAFLGKLPFNTTNAVIGQIPPFKTVFDGDENAAQDRVTYKINLQSAVDSGVMYFLTGNQDYARYSASIFYTYMKAMKQVPLSSSTNFNAGWIYPLDHLREARDFGAQLPIIYDFIATFIKEGGTAYDFAADAEVTIDRLEAETIFKNYIFLAKNRGGLHTNWPILESPSLVSNILALDSDIERALEIPYYINVNTTRQASLDKVSKTYTDNGGTWPEPFTYSRYVGEYSTYLMNVMTKYDPSLNLVDKYANIPLSLDISNDFVYPNKNRVVQFGDTSRSFAKYVEGYEMAYHLGKLTNNQALLDKFGILINSSVTFDGYNRASLSATRSTAVEPYFEEPIRLLWYEPTVDGVAQDIKQNVTENLAFAGVSLQRNIDVPDPLNRGLMLFVGGAGFVHSYASGMNMELYGPKTVLGAAAGNTKEYTSEIHTNYYRLFAAHNTVIVNGSSQGLGGNVNIDVNTVEKLAIEPEYKQSPVSSKNSFSTTKFLDDKGSKSEALQYRTMAIVRTSPTSGYYVDVFKSKSSLANEYHDYVYHNLADNLQLKNSANTDLNLTDDSDRYPIMNTNGGFKNPGWHYFTDIKTSGVITDDVNATFTATRLGGSVNMKMHIPGEANREYTRVNAPPTLGLSSSYENTPTPTVLIRKTGEAWNTPFSVIYEPYWGENTNTVVNVQNIKRNGVFAGMQVESVISGKNIKQIILIRDNDNAVFNDATLDVELTGRFVVLSMDENDELTSIYMGKGSRIKYKGWEINSKNDEATGFYVEITGKNATIKTNAELNVTSPNDITITENVLINNGTLSIENEEFTNFISDFIFYKKNSSNIWNLETKHIEFDANTQVKIINILGLTVLNKKINSPVTELDLNHISNGMYVVLITKNNAIITTKKVIVDKN